MEQHLRFVALKEIGKVCYLQKSLYGLKQGPHARFGKLSQTVETFGMQESKSNHFIYINSSFGLFLLVVYVDDIGIIGSDFNGMSSLKTFLYSQFHIKDLGMLNYCLGVEA